MRDVVGFDLTGYEVRVYSLRPFNSREVIHEFARPTLAWARRFPYLSWDVLNSVIRWLRTKPLILGSLIRDILWEGRSDLLVLLKSLFILPESLRIADDLLEWQVDHVHAAYAGHPATCAWIVKRIIGVPYSVSTHAYDIFETRALLAIKLRDAEFVRTISQFNRNYLIQNWTFLSKRPPIVIHVGVSLDDIPLLPPPQNKPFRVLYVGSLERRKGVDILLHALTKAKLSHWQAAIVGDGPEQRRLRRLTRKLKLSGYVTFWGAQSFEEVRRFLANCSVLVVPSRSGARSPTEGLPTIIVEALAHQRPVIASRLSGIPEIIRDKETGLLVDAEDIEGLGKALREINCNAAVAYARAARGRRLVECEFDQNRNIAVLANLIGQSMNRK